jgi:hypothetical protein
MVSVFLLVIGFARLNLTNQQQSLGLPSGSVRALIALSLIVVFAIYGLYLFGTFSSSIVTLEGLEQKQVNEISPDKIISKTTNGNGTFNVTIRVDISRESAQLAQQLITIVGTLIGAVAGFYFGTRSLATAGHVATPTQPEIHMITPSKVKPGGELEAGFQAEILGRDFHTPRVVKLIQPSKGKEIVATDILSSATKITCAFKIAPEDQLGKWNLIVVNEDGEKAELTEAFTVNTAEA